MLQMWKYISWEYETLQGVENNLHTVLKSGIRWQWVVSLVPQAFEREGGGTIALGTLWTGDWVGCRADVEGQESWSCGFGCSQSGVDKDSGILVCYVMSTGKCSTTFRNTISSSILYFYILWLLNSEYGGNTLLRNAAICDYLPVNTA
jgi:hypothetical protein